MRTTIRAATDVESPVATFPVDEGGLVVVGVVADGAVGFVPVGFVVVDDEPPVGVVDDSSSDGASEASVVGSSDGVSEASVVGSSDGV